MRTSGATAAKPRRSTAGARMALLAARAARARRATADSILAKIGKFARTTSAKTFHKTFCPLYASAPLSSRLVHDGGQRVGAQRRPGGRLGASPRCVPHRSFVKN
jgi:hypothetical protein